MILSYKQHFVRGRKFMNNDFYKEIENNSIEELELIFETQKELYSNEEMKMITQRILELKSQKEQFEQERLKELLPKEIECPKCDGINRFEATECKYCGYNIEKEKAKYYSLDYYENDNDDTLDDSEDEKDGNYLFQYIISFLIPLIGFILGAILLSKDDEQKSVGKVCIIIGIVSTIISSISISILYSTVLYNIV